jgi:hypothetical protein
MPKLRDFRWYAKEKMMSEVQQVWLAYIAVNMASLLKRH